MTSPPNSRSARRSSASHGCPSPAALDQNEVESRSIARAASLPAADDEARACGTGGVASAGGSAATDFRTQAQRAAVPAAVGADLELDPVGGMRRAAGRVLEVVEDHPRAGNRTSH